MNLLAFGHWKLLLITALVQLISFACGLYSGHTYWPKQQINAIPVNYTTDSSQPTTSIKEGQGTTTPPPASLNCPVKGNISSKNKIYHIKGGAFYDRTQEEMCFQTEAEAIAAGFIKSTR